MHVLDWLEHGELISKLREFVAPIGFAIPDSAAFQPQGRHSHRETLLIGDADPFLDVEHRKILRDWWVLHTPAKFPTWDFVTNAQDNQGRPALILVEAKAHATELTDAGKENTKRDTPDQQKRTDENHNRIAVAICEAERQLIPVIPRISLSRDVSYQFCNRVAFSWKLASLGVPVALVYLGFTHDSGIARAGDYFATSDEWMRSFVNHVVPHFPRTHFRQEIRCGKASFWLLPADLPCKNQTPPVGQRKELA